MKRLAPILLEFSQRYPEVSLDMDFSDRRVNLIEEGIDLSIRITRRLESGDVARKIGSSRMLVVASPDYLARHGRPESPAELANHVCLGYTNAGNSQVWQFMVDGQLESFHIRSRLNANNGDVLIEAVAQGLGISCKPDFIAEPFLVSGRVEEILADFPIPALGIYAMLPSNRHVPHRVRVLMDTLGEQLAAP
jgi:DNA-binding transcriptional LysR family regulator